MKGEDLKRIRTKFNITQAQMATILKVPNKQLIYQWETGIRNPSNIVQHIYKLLDTLDDDSVTELIEKFLMAEV